MFAAVLVIPSPPQPNGMNCSGGNAESDQEKAPYTIVHVPEIGTRDRQISITNVGLIDTEQKLPSIVEASAKPPEKNYHSSGKQTPNAIRSSHSF